jgi:hypothetical protein
MRKYQMLILGTCLVLAGCGRPEGQREVLGKLDAIKCELAAKRAEPLRWAFANKRQVEAVVFQWSRDKMAEEKKAEALSPEMEEKIRQYEVLQGQLMRKEMDMRGFRLPIRAGSPQPSVPDEDYLVLSNRLAEAKAPIADILERRNRQESQYREQYKIDQLISEYAKDRFDLVVDSSDDHFSHSVVLYRTNMEVLDVTDGIIKLFKEKAKL